jgi:chemotaxis protein MotB
MAGGDGKGDAPIIIRKGKKGHGDAHGGAWKVAYADFVTAMMALFIVLWIMSQGNEVREKVAEYFKNPIGIAVGKGASVIDGNKPSITDAKILDDKRTKEMEQEKLKEMSQQIEEKMKDSPEFKDLSSLVQLEMTDEGLRIELIDSSKATDYFFEIGTAKLNAKAQKLLEMVGEQLQKLPNGIVVEGHTDARPFPNGKQGYSNYELSADRANSARRALYSGGLSDTRIQEIRGYADKKLKNPANPYDLVNRRISIIVKYPGAK